MNSHHEELVEQINWLICRVRELESENYRLRLASGLASHKRKRGRPTKQKEPKQVPQKAGRKKLKVPSNVLKFINEKKKEYGVKSDKEALQKFAEAKATERGEAKYRANESDVQAFLKTMRNQISKARKSQKQ